MVSRDAAPEADSPAVNFIAKLFAMISDPELGGVVCWNPAGDALQIPHPGAFAHSVLPKFFKHNRTRSFIRQLYALCSCQAQRALRRARAACASREPRDAA